MVEFKFNNLGLVLDIALKFYKSLAKGFKLKAGKILGLIPRFVEVTKEKLVRKAFLVPQSLIRLRSTSEI